MNDRLYDKTLFLALGELAEIKKDFEAIKDRTAAYENLLIKIEKWLMTDSGSYFPHGSKELRLEIKKALTQRS